MSDKNTLFWTKQLVQQHARVAVAVELYTMPFYFTALASIKDTRHPYYEIIQSVCIEEMLHIQLAANLCLALDTFPCFAAPVYGHPVEFLKPYDPATGHHSLINAELGPLDETRLGMMLDIESPEPLLYGPSRHLTPEFPYNSIQELYDALLSGIEQVGEDSFAWSTIYQQVLWTMEQPFPQVIDRLETARRVVLAISRQGEGAYVPTPPQERLKLLEIAPLANIHMQTPASQTPVALSTTLDPEDYPLPAEDRLATSFSYPQWTRYSHFGRFLIIENDMKRQGYRPGSNHVSAFPEVYVGRPGATDHPDIQALQQAFAATLENMNQLWRGQVGTVMPMVRLLPLAQRCWRSGVTPVWS
ncbi:MAG: hypothetical protein HQL75_17125 [Magnetococcales bacterium]|nr:hypothetical protein [Magnetococcales bacterium]